MKLPLRCLESFGLARLCNQGATIRQATRSNGIAKGGEDVANRRQLNYEHNLPDMPAAFHQILCLDSFVEAKSRKNIRPKLSRFDQRPDVMLDLDGERALESRLGGCAVCCR